MTSKWISSAPPLAALRTSSASSAKLAANIEGAPTTLLPSCPKNVKCAASVSLVQRAPFYRTRPAPQRRTKGTPPSLSGRLMTLRAAGLSLHCPSSLAAGARHASVVAYWIGTDVPGPSPPLCHRFIGVAPATGPLRLGASPDSGGPRHRGPGSGWVLSHVRSQSVGLVTCPVESPQGPSRNPPRGDAVCRSWSGSRFRGRISARRVSLAAPRSAQAPAA